MELLPVVSLIQDSRRTIESGETKCTDSNPEKIGAMRGLPRTFSTRIFLNAAGSRRASSGLSVFGGKIAPPDDGIGMQISYTSVTQQNNRADVLSLGTMVGVVFLKI